MKRRIVLRPLVVAMLATFCTVAVSPDKAAADPGGATCNEVDITVPVLLGTSTLHGRLCLPPGPTPATVMVMVPGATYNLVYWDFPYKPALYSFSRAMNKGGYATFTVDRLGTGQSGRPLSTQLTGLVQANALHMAIQQLRAGGVGGVAFSRVILLGHSLGSSISVLEVATFHDVDAFAMTGLTHHPDPLAALALFTDSFRPAFLDPQIGHRGYDPGYFTTLPGTRYAKFHAPAQVDPNVVATDEATKDVYSTTESPDALGIGMLSPYSTLINVPVLIALGSQDPLFCSPLATNCSSPATVLAAEQPYWLSSPCLSAYLLQGSGHSLNLNPATADFQDAVLDWADVSVGSTNPPPPTPTC